MKASPGRRWLWCEIHGTERAVDSVRAPKVSEPAVCVSFPGRQAEGIRDEISPLTSSNLLY